MSNPVTNADIEDVLSSIRRLVSEDARPQAAPEKVDGMDRLVLTPALRVMESERPEEVTSGEAVEDCSDVSEDQVPEEMPRPELLETHELVDLNQDDTGRRNLEARIAELEAVISDTGDHWEQDGEEGSANAGGPVQSLNWEESSDDTEVEESDPSAEQEHDVDEAGFVEMAEEPFLASEPVDFPIEPSTEVEDDFAPDDYEQASLDEEVADAAERSDESDEEYSAEAATEVVVDEDMLRELVAEVVRQELQGALGERITRNVRKLVRREIHRALTSQELE
ncbi:hypothetical protein [Thalassovita sp.]|uniref:hypothetical protein n=1 Tax=Thalassovita sp. TaxID=1979401 RepID=UPI002881FB1E|nr:hypothetical protein [Thalassovita sp.]MDF1803070.1 hypothetical protein [Thalassovita sp.]